MFSAVVHKELASAEGYFVEHLAQNDYYAAGEIRPGQWIGIGADRLGLNAGKFVNREQFYSLCENRHPETGNRLTLRQNEKDKRRVFFDFTCSAPKSVSVLAITLNDQRLVEAHKEASRVAFRELEELAATRIRKASSQRDRTTGNLVAAAFVHSSSRALDPQLHTHFTVFNATFDNQEQCWKALQARAMYDAIQYATAVYRNELARRVREIGYRTSAAKHGFEIEGVGEGVMRKFSKRAQEVSKIVGEMEKKLGRKLSNNEVSYTVHQSRTKKLKGISTSEVRERQLTQLSRDELQSLRALMDSAQLSREMPPLESERAALTHAVAHVFERRSVVPEHELLIAALEYRLGGVDLPRLKERVSQSPELVRTNRGFSTRKILETELSLIETVNAGRDTDAPLHPMYQPAGWLSEDQQRAILYVLRTNDRITGVRGLAGTGKTTALHELVVACREVQIEPLFCAPTAAATDVLKKEGFEAVTLQSLLWSKPVLSKRNLVVLDEAGAVGIDDMKRLFDLAAGARIVLSGDTGQHASVARGDALRILEEYSDFQSGQLTRIRRQRRAEYRKAVELAAQKRTTEAFAQLERIGAIAECPRDNLHEWAARFYLEVLKRSKSALLVAPTWNEIEVVTENVRELLKMSGHLGNEERDFRVFDSLSWTEAQKRDARQYRSGMLLHFHQKMGGFAKDESLEVADATDDSLRLRRNDGSEISLNLNTVAAAFDVGESRTIRIASGDKLLLQANWRKKFINGELVEVRAIQGDSILLADGREIPAHYRTFTHGYAVTSHAAQGKTADEVLVVASSRSLPAIHREQFYVSISRGRDTCHILTDDTDLLRSHVAHSSARIAAVEAVPGIQSRKFTQRIMQRGYRFLKHFRQRMAQTQSILPRKKYEQQHEPSYESKRQPRRSIGV